MLILRPGVLEALELRPMAQLLSLIGTLLILVYCIPDEGVRQRDVSEDRSHPPKVLVIGSVKDVADSASRVQFTWQAVLHIDSRGEASLPPFLLPHPLHFILCQPASRNFFFLILTTLNLTPSKRFCSQTILFPLRLN